MKTYFTCALALAFLWSVLAYGDEQTKKKPLNWQPLYGMKIPGMKGYFDANSIVPVPGNYNVGTVLFVYTDDATDTVNDKEIKFKSLVKNIMVDCKSGDVATLVDYYFVSSMPKRSDKPVTGVRYPEPGPEDIVKMGPQNPIVKSICPSYV